MLCVNDDRKGRAADDQSAAAHDDDPRRKGSFVCAASAVVGCAIIDVVQGPYFDETIKREPNRLPSPSIVAGAALPQPISPTMSTSRVSLVLGVVVVDSDCFALF